ncbi:MAG: LysE family translocator [Pseudomonadota bacterium]
MSFEIWLSFVLASALVVLIPGPNIVLTVDYALRYGLRSGLATVPGVALGAFVAMSVSLAGAGAVLAASVVWFSVLKLLGALYLLWLAYALWTAPAPRIEGEAAPVAAPMGRVFGQSFLVSALNPKGPAFYIAFVPQFVAADGPVLAQFALLVGTFLGVATLNSLLWLLCASRLRRRLQGPTIRRVLTRIGAGCLGAAGLLAIDAVIWAK